MRAVADTVPGASLDVDSLDLEGSAGFEAAFDIDTAAFAAAGLSNLAAGVTKLDRDRVVAAFSTHVHVDGHPLPVWADLSGYYLTSDGGYLQLHCNFPHHAAGVVQRLRCEPDRASVQEAVLRWDPADLEMALIADGMIPARMRSRTEWDAHPHAVATASLPLIGVIRIGDGEPRPRGRILRVLDCSRVLAGPVAGMALAAHGADVLRVGAAHLPSIEVGVIATGFGKRNAFVDVRSESETYAALLDTCDVWIDAFRPGSFARFGFTPEACAPGTVVVQISAFDWVGPWAGRRGYDSIVQTTTGIVAEGRDMSGSDQPTPLPVQALDYCTGYLAAFVARRLVEHQAQVGGTWLARLSLLRTRNWLVGLAEPRPFTPAKPSVSPSALGEIDSPFGMIRAPLSVGGVWGGPPQPLGSSSPSWLPGENR